MFDLQPSVLSYILLGIAIVWVMPWKAVALWRSARNGSVPWFIVLLIFNTLGILEILYSMLFLV